ncbi:MAG: zinc-binding alcohol dehydrogenase [Alphaproteobacteria bacterium]|nr:zinc-binding alcohol dehydrogenase [Alphaproteobacteria bacterium]
MASRTTRPRAGAGALAARAFWVIGPGRGAIRTERLPRPGKDQALVRTLASGVSRGTESLVFQGRVPESQWPVMRAPLMGGDFPFPVKYGYSAVGVVERGPAGLRGKRVFCLHPHQDRFVVDAHWLVPVPDAVPDGRAVLAANMETALNVTWDARPLPGERILVIGAGVVGALVASILGGIPAVRLVLCDADPAKADLAAALGLGFCLPSDAPRDNDLIVHASGNPQGLALALGRAAFEGRIVEASWFGDKACELPLGEAFHARRLTLISSQVGHVAPAMRARRSHAERVALALDLLADPRYEALLHGLSRFAELPRTMRGLAAAPGPLCHVVRYD